MNHYKFYLSFGVVYNPIRVKTKYKRVYNTLVIKAINLSEAIESIKLTYPNWDINMFWLEV